MLQSSSQETDQASDSMETMNRLLVDAIKGIVYESHDEHVDYEEEPKQEASRQRSSGSSGGGSVLPMLLVGVAFAAVGYVMGKRSQSGGQMGGGGMQARTGEAAHRTEEMAGSTADTIRETGEKLSERTEETAESAADRIEEGSEEVGDRVEESGSKAADEMEDNG